MCDHCEMPGYLSAVHATTAHTPFIADGLTVLLTHGGPLMEPVGWRCTGCGAVTDGPTLPTGHLCPTTARTDRKGP